MNANGACGAAVTARARIGWVKFKECRKLLNSKRFLSAEERNDLSKLCEISDVIRQ